MNTGITIGLASIVVGLGGVALAYWAYRRGGGARARIVVSLQQLAVIDPASLGLRVSLKVGRQAVLNLLLLELAVTNEGPVDVVPANPENPGAQDQRPRVELPTALKAVADPWNPDGAQPAADVRVARSLSDEDRQLLHVHIHRLARKATVRSHILCTREVGISGELAGSEIRFFPGFIPNASVVPAGLLKASRRSPSA